MLATGPDMVRLFCSMRACTFTVPHLDMYMYKRHVAIGAVLVLGSSHIHTHAHTHTNSHTHSHTVNMAY